MKRIELKSVMLDMARVTEKISYYKALPERLANWGYNAVFIHLVDDEGCAMQFDRRPELTTAHAFSQAQMRDWIATCGHVGIEVIPEIESFGHTGYIHGLEKYAHLREPTPGYFNALNPLHPDSKAVLRDLIEETAAVFPGRFIHTGLDEVNFGDSAEVRQALKKKQKWEIFADHINFMHELVRSAGKRMMMWGDHLLHEPQIADRISTEIVICDWHYQADVKADTLEFFTSRGFETLACPASNRSGDMILPNATTQINLQRFARLAHDGGKRVVGLMNTVWCPQRMLCGIEQFAMALAGAWFNNPDANPHQVVADFLRSQYGLVRVDKLADAVLTLSRVNPGRVALRRWLNTEVRPTPTLTDCEAAQAAELFDRAIDLGELLAKNASRVKTNQEEYLNYVLAAELLSWSAIVALNRTGARDPEVTKDLKAEGRRLLKLAVADWNRGRHKDDPKRDLKLPEAWVDALIPNLHLALERLK